VSRPLAITVLTPSLDQAAFVERTIESVLSQRGHFTLEYLVQDGGSTDGTQQVLARYAAAGRLTARVEPDRGQADAVNKALAAATGEVIGWVNSDDLLLPGALDRVAQAFTADPSLVWLHSRCRIIDEQDRPIRRWLEAYKHRKARHHTFERLLVENYISQMTVFVRRSALVQVGPLDPELHYTFDYDLWLRLARLAPPRYLDEPLAAFRFYRTSKSGARYPAQFAEDWQVFLRHAPPSRLLRLRKRGKTGLILAVYRALDLLGRLGRSDHQRAARSEGR
jgi:glycosyltransferase involved in cell wall biosynthesis